LFSIYCQIKLKDLLLAKDAAQYFVKESGNCRLLQELFSPLRQTDPAVQAYWSLPVLKSRTNQFDSMLFLLFKL
jgi:hypothetical protein